MKVQGRVKRKMAAKTKASIFLAIALILTIALAWISLTGIPLDKEGLYRLNPWVPTTNAENWPKNLSLGLDLKGGVFVEYTATPPANAEANFDALMDGTISIIGNRLTEKGYTESTVTRFGTNGIRVEIPEVSDTNEVLNLIGSPAKLEFVDPEGNVFMEGKDVVSAQPSAYQEGLDYKYVIQFKLSSEGSKLFADVTSKSIGKNIAIHLDGEELMAPVVNQAITGGEGTIEGNFTAEEAERMAIQIQSGALPLDIRQDRVDTISATLGIDALATSIKAAVIGIVIVMVILFAIYRVAAIAANWALVLYLIMLFFLLAIVPGIQLTLPGIAGIILGIGMAVDANVVIFERIGEEIGKGRGVKGAVKIGFQNAMSAVIDANVTTIIAAVVLMLFGTGTIQGFAITLFLSVIVSMISAIFITKVLLKNIVTLVGDKPALFTRKKAQVKEAK